MEQEFHDNTELSIVRLKTSGDISETRVVQPPSTDYYQPLSYMSCGDETTYLSFINSEENVDIYKFNGSGNDHPLVKVGSFGHFPDVYQLAPWLVNDGAIRFMTDHGTLATYSYDSLRVEETPRLFPADQRIVNLTFDGDEFYITTQPLDGKAELRIHTYSLADPQPSEKGDYIGSLNGLLQVWAGGYAIPMAVYPKPRD